jgi:hypothetical protein
MSDIFDIVVENSQDDLEVIRGFMLTCGETIAPEVTESMGRRPSGIDRWGGDVFVTQGKLSLSVNVLYDFPWGSTDANNHPVVIEATLREENPSEIVVLGSILLNDQRDMDTIEWLFDGLDWNPQSQVKFIRKSARNARIEYVCETLNLWQMEARWENQTLGEKARTHYRRAYLAKKGELTELLENDVM